MLVIVTENSPARLNGYLSRVLLEIRSGVFVGDYNVRVRMMLWSKVCSEIEEGNAIMAWSTNNESGFDFDTFGPNRRIPTILDGLKLVAFLPPGEKNEEKGKQ